MGRYITSSEFFARYSQIKDYGANHVESHFILYAENQLDSMLSNYFTTPFSSDNLTAKDLSMELTYIRSADLKFADREKREEHFMKKIKALINGETSMVSSSGVLSTVGDTISITNGQYHQTFGMGDVENYLVDSSQTYDEFLERHI